MSDSQSNPYAAPVSELTAPQAASHELELLATRRFRTAVGLLLPPALFNCVAVTLPRFVDSGRVPATDSWAFFSLAVTIVGMVFLLGIAVFLWFRGTMLLMFITALLHPLLGGRTERNGWIDAALEGTRGFVVAAVLGSIVWLTYDILLFFQPSHYSFFLFFGTLAHILGAIMYVPILVKWFRYRRAGAPRKVEVVDEV